MKKELPKTYNPHEFEEEIYALWEKSGLFSPDKSKSKETYCNILPPPNANGELHLGHASGYAVMDILGRYQRMKGKKTLLLPGKDHAGIQTQVVFERKIKEDRGITRHELGREEFYKECFSFTTASSAYMRSQEKKMGLSADWSREKFTLDPDVVQVAMETFVKMYTDGMIYQGNRIINWCPRCATALSDVEVVHKETDGKMYFIQYPIKDSKEFVTVATTRPETMLGDTAVAVNPKDKRYTKLIGKTIILPLQNKEIPIISDRRIDAEFGTGAVKITPAHDPLDWQIGKDHQLEEIQVIDEQAHITPLGGKYAGQNVSEARKNILNDLEKINLLEKEEDLKINKSACERCKSTIEPLVSKQWFISVNDQKNSLKKIAIQAIKENKVEIYPSNFKKILIDWFENMHDWCISRQIWWGPQFPVWYKTIPAFEDLASLKKQCSEIEMGAKGSLVYTKTAPEFRFVIQKEDWDWIKKNVSISHEYEYADFFDGKNRTRISGNSFTITPKNTPARGVVVKKGQKGTWKKITVSLEERSTDGFARYEIEFKGKIPPYFQKRKLVSSTEILKYQKQESNRQAVLVSLEKPLFEGWTQDENTFDTWFSSGQWPYSTLGYPSQKDFKQFYPTDMMVMGRDILFFWSARMIMLGLYRTGKIPFKKLYFSGLVRDKDGNKMSKSRGNGIDVLEMIEKYGSDALRISLIADAAPGQDFRLYEEKIENSRNYINKIWNISRYCTTSSKQFRLWEKISSRDLKSASDHWIINLVNKLTIDVESLLEKNQISLAAEKIRIFTWNDFADWYLEINKIEKNQKVLGYVLDKVLRLFHPFSPFVTENIFQIIQNQKGRFLMSARWPEKKNQIAVSKKSIGSFESLIKLISEIRNVRSIYKIDPQRKISLSIRTSTPKLFKESENIIKRLARVESIDFIKKENAPQNSAIINLEKNIIYIHLESIIDLQKEKSRFEKEIINLEKYIKGLEFRLQDKNFTQKAPTEIIKQQQASLVRAKKELRETQKNLTSIA